MKPHVVFAKGIPDHGLVEVLGVNEDGSISYASPGAAGVSRFLASDAFEASSLMLDKNPASRIRLARPPDVLFNEIADADTHRLSLSKVQALIPQFGPRCAVINPPEAIAKTSRDQIYARLQGIPGLTVPLTLRLRPESPEAIRAAMASSGLRFPVILRECGLHGGEKTVLIRGEAELQRLHALALDGREYYLIQYHDCREPDGVFRKSRLVVIDGEPWLRHVRACDHWMIHAANAMKFMNAHPRFIDEEAGIFARFETEYRPRFLPLLARIHERLGLDYYGLDFTLGPDGSLLLFELNASMLVLARTDPGTTRYDEPVRRIHDAIVRMILARVSP